MFRVREPVEEVEANAIKLSFPVPKRAFRHTDICINLVLGYGISFRSDHDDTKKRGSFTVSRFQNVAT